MTIIVESMATAGRNVAEMVAESSLLICSWETEKGTGPVLGF